jgi:hypothetical protein
MVQMQMDILSSVGRKGKRFSVIYVPLHKFTWNVEVKLHTFLVVSDEGVRQFASFGHFVSGKELLIFAI